jgi:hypothetical protein
MPVYLVTGKLGAGKSLVCVGRIQEMLRQGRRVATNLDLNLPEMLSAKSRVSCVRLPDKPRVGDLAMLGAGNDSMDESQNGAIVLDELASWLNARTWKDDGRAEVIDWLIHSRKFGWDVYFVCQHENQIDRQIREALVEYLVVCRRLDRLRIPFLGSLVGLLSFGFLSGRFPRVHIASVRYGTEVGALRVERWWYLGNDLFKAYNTRQVFSAGYAHGVFSYLSPWHLVGRFKRGLTLRELARVAGVWLGWLPPLARVRGHPARRLGPLMRVRDRDARWRAARRLVGLGKL